MPTKTRSGVHYDPANIKSEQKGVVEPGVKWEKALWRKQPFPDNYVPQSFLAELKALRRSLLE
jgi:phosphatidylinositol glycan class C protein